MAAILLHDFVSTGLTESSDSGREHCCGVRTRSSRCTRSGRIQRLADSDMYANFKSPEMGSYDRAAEMVAEPLA